MALSLLRTTGVRSSSIIYSRLHIKQYARTLSSSLPYHLVVGLPALSPTMNSGSLAEWYVAEGDSFSAGDALAKIETDKASIDFESQDDGFVAKILVEAGTGADIAVGAPIMLTVEEEEHLPAFKDYVLPADAAPTEEAVAEEKPAEVESSPPPPPPVAAAAPPPVAAPVPPETPPAAPALSLGNKVTPVWGMVASKASPLAKTLASQQVAYIEKYGTTGQKPLATE